MCYGTLAQNVPSLRGPCDHCGQPGTAYHVFSDGGKAYLCPPHRQMQAIADAAIDDLRLLVGETLAVWLEQYHTIPAAMLGLGDALHDMAQEVAEEARKKFEEALPPVAEAAD